MKIKITESQYKKIFLSGKFDNILLEQGPVKILDTFLDDIVTISRYTGTKSAKNFATDFSDDIIRRIEREFGVVDGTIKNFDDFKRVLQSHSGPISVDQFKSLLKIRNVVIKNALLNALSKDSNIYRILSLYKKAETAGRNDIMSDLRARLKIYLDSDAEVSDFIVKYKSSVVAQVETLINDLDDGLFKMFKSIQNEEQFLKLKNEATSLLRNIETSGYKLFKDTKQWSDFKRAEELLNIITGKREEFIKFQEFIEKNKIDIDLLKKQIKDKNPNIFSKILGMSDSIRDKSKSIFYLFMTLLILSIAATLGYTVYKVYDLFKGTKTSSNDDDQITTNFKNKILDKEFSSIIIDNKLINLTPEDKNLNRENLTDKLLTITNTPMDSKGIEYKLFISVISINDEIYQNAEILYNSTNNSYVLLEKGNVQTKEDIKNLKDEGNVLKYKALEETNYIPKEYISTEYIKFIKSTFNEKPVYEIIVEKEFKKDTFTFKKGEPIYYYVVLWDNNKKSWVAKQVNRDSSGQITKIIEK